MCSQTSQESVLHNSQKVVEVLFRCPIYSQSGYGVHSRIIATALLLDGRFSVQIVTTNWGNNQNAVLGDSETELFDAAIQFQLHDPRKALLMHVGLPWEAFNPDAGGLIRGLVTVLETDKCTPKWSQACNQWNFVITASTHARESMIAGGVTVPIYVVSEGVDISVYNENALPFDIDLKADKNFLFIGQWLNGSIGNDRKNVGLLIKTFLETFKGKDNVGLILKTKATNESIPDRVEIEGRIKAIRMVTQTQDNKPPITLIHGNLTNREMAGLYTHPKIQYFINPTKGEGYGLSLIQAASSALPLIVTGWSGHMDFLDRAKIKPLPYKLENVHPEVYADGIFEPDTKLAVIKDKEILRALKDGVTGNYSRVKQRAVELSKSVQRDHNFDVVQKHFSDVVYNEFTTRIMEADALIDDKEAFNILFTMPQTAGDVLLSTAVIAELYKKFEGAHIYYATTVELYGELLLGNPYIHRVIEYGDSLLQWYDFESVFDIVYTPHYYTQQFTNWVHNGYGKHLLDQYFKACDLDVPNELNYHLQLEPVSDDIKIPEEYLTINTSASTGSKNYKFFQNIVNTIDLTFIHMGGPGDAELVGDNVIDLRGKTTMNQAGTVIKNSRLHIGVDSLQAHMCSVLNTESVILYGATYPQTTGPRTLSHSIITPSLHTCNRVCHLPECFVNKDNPCINNINSNDVIQKVIEILASQDSKRQKPTLEIHKKETV